jgi:hypothetical protein
VLFVSLSRTQEEGSEWFDPGTRDRRPINDQSPSTGRKKGMPGSHDRRFSDAVAAAPRTFNASR